MQCLVLLSSGIGYGVKYGSAVKVTELPQTVAIFHSLVGLAATFSCLSSFMACADPDIVHKVSAFTGTFIGGVTFSGSIVAFLKLSGVKMDKMNLPYSKYINKPLALSNALALTAMMYGSNGLGLSALYYSAFSSSILGWNIINSMGAADMPVAVTILNS